MKEKQYLQIFEAVNNTGALVVRILIWLVLILLVYLGINDGFPAKYIVSIIFIFLIHETFIHFRINKLKPNSTVSDSNGSYLYALMPRERIWWEHTKDAYQLAMLYSHKPECRQMIHRLNFEFVLERIDIPKEDLLVTTGKLLEKINGRYIHAIDLLAAYLLLSEKHSKSLHHFNIKEEEFISLYIWLRNHYQIDVEQNQIHFSGAGVFDFFVFGWDGQIKEYTQNLTHHVITQKYRPILSGREDLYEQFLSILSKDHTGNVLLVGDPGTGKNSVVEYFASSSYNGTVPVHLNHLIVYELLVDRILSGVNNQGELEERLLFVLSEITHSGNAVIYIPNIENIFGGGGFDFDLSGVLFEYLKNDAIRVIGATTPKAYSEYIQEKESVASFFDTLEVSEPDEHVTIHMLLQRVGELEHQHGITIDFSAVKESAVLAKSYTPDHKLPGSAFDLLQTTISQQESTHQKVITGEDVRKLVSKKTHILLSEPDTEEKELLLHMEDEIHKRLVNQEGAVRAIASTLRRLRSGFINTKKPIGVFLFLGPTGVGKTEMAKALAEIYFQNEKNMIRFDMSEFHQEDSIKRLLGEGPHEEYIPHTLTEQITKHPFSVVLLDEFEKANPSIHNLFLQAFDEGRITSNKAEEVSLKQAIIIATSNAGSEFIREKVKSGVNEQVLHEQLMEYLLQSQQFKPELINRFDEIIIFKPLSLEHIQKIAIMILTSVLQSLEEKEYFLTFDGSVVEHVSSGGYSEEYGARNIRRYIQNTVEEVVARWILEEKVEKNKKYLLSINDQNELILNTA